ncbi:unnamed protein product [Paramecium pentaurelia]|uniref:Uncharacterized protein n=1 Tax=Paramecium pentaurelia TaxID=43138 RepID=A0A8S1T7V9_9CILI|nr:unnamed protein product [Paramecium pentaurelia]
MFQQNDYPTENISLLNQIFQDLKQQDLIQQREDQSQKKQFLSVINKLVVQFQEEKEFKVDQFKTALEIMIVLLKNDFKKSSKNIEIKAWNNYAKKFIKEFDIVRLYLSILSFLDHDQEQIEDQINIIVEIFKYYSSDQELYSLMIDLIYDWSFQKSPQWLLLIENLCQIIIENNQNLPINIRALRMLNSLFLQNSNFKIIEKYGILNQLQNIVYLYIDNSTLCVEVTRLFSILVFRYTQEFLQIFVKFNFIISIFIQHLDNDQIVLHTIRILGCFLKAEAFISGFMNMEILRLFTEWSQKIGNQNLNLSQLKKTSIIMLLIIELLIEENKLSQQAIEEYLIQFCTNIIDHLTVDLQICTKVYQIISKFTINKKINNQIFDCKTFKCITNSYIVQKYEKQFQLTVLQFFNSLILSDIEKIDLIISSTISQQLLMSIQNQFDYDSYQEIDGKITLEILRYIQLVSQDSIKCSVVWSTDSIQKLFYQIQQSTLRKDVRLIELFLNILSIYSQLEITEDFIITNTNTLLKIIEDNILSYEICDDFANILQNLINSQHNNIHLLIDQFVPLSLIIIKNQPEQQTLVLRFFDIYEQISKIDLQSRLRIQDLCSIVMQEFEQQKFIHPYLNTLNEYIGRCSFSYQNLLTKEARDYLVNGIHCKLYKDDGSVSSLLVFITPDLASIWCKHHGDSNTKQKWRLATKHVISIKDYLNDVEGWRLSPFKKFGKKKIDINSCFTITGNIILNKQIQLQNFHICAPTALDKYKMFEYLRALVQIN